MKIILGSDESRTIGFQTAQYDFNTINDLLKTALDTFVHESIYLKFQLGWAISFLVGPTSPNPIPNPNSVFIHIIYLDVSLIDIVRFSAQYFVIK